MSVKMSGFVCVFVTLFGLAITSSQFVQKGKLYYDLHPTFITVDVPSTRVVYPKKQQFKNWNISSRVTGGSNSPSREYPFQASVQYSKAGHLFQHICGGAIIAPEWVITAAHCLQNGYYVVQAGLLYQNDNNDDVQTVVAVQAIAHPEWPGRPNAIQPNDIGLLKLQSPLKWTKAVKAIQFPKEESYPSGKCEITGWGYLDSSWPVISRRLQYATIPIITLQECNEAITKLTGESNIIDGAMVCAGPLKGGKAPCNGDSGGPLSQTTGIIFKDVFLIGVLAWGGDPCGKVGVPSIYMNTVKYLPWVRQYVENI